MRQTIQRKDDLIQQLREQLEEAEIRGQQAEALLDKQRRELVGE